MTISELIKQLQRYKNQEAKVLITIGNEDNDTLSTGDFELFNEDGDKSQEYIEIFINEDTCKKQV